jgi:hypothetical protein
MNDLYSKECENYKAQMKKLAEEMFDEIVAERLPWLESDTQQNVEIRTQEVVRELLAGNFTVDGDYLTLQNTYCRVNIRVTECEWDNFRESLIKLMPVCPKDAKIHA